MPPSFCVAGQLQAFLVAPQQKAQIAEKTVTAFWTKLLSASSEALEISKWDTPMIFFIKNCVPLSKRITYLFTLHQNKEAAEQLNYIPKFTNKVSKKTQVSWDRWKILQCTRRQTFFFLHQHDGLT